jgi:acetyltransferase-like isoleucine patch superfamily enzyme
MRMGIVNLYKRFINVSRIFMIKNINKNIQLAYSNKVHKTVLFSLVGGGVIKIGNGNDFLQGVSLMTYGGSIEIGDRCSINPYCILYGHGGLKIGNDVLIAGHCLIIPANHIFSNKEVPINTQGETKKGIRIEDDVWIGSGCSILDGVIIGKGAVIAAGSVVNSNVDPFTVYAGVPAKKIKNR